MQIYLIFLKTYTSVSPEIDFGGQLLPNKILSNVQILVQDEVYGPESIAIRGNDIYTGDNRGKVVKITSNGEVSTIAKLEFPCSKANTFNLTYLIECHRVSVFLQLISLMNRSSGKNNMQLSSCYEV